MMNSIISITGFDSQIPGSITEEVTTQVTSSAPVWLAIIAVLGLVVALLSIAGIFLIYARLKETKIEQTEAKRTFSQYRYSMSHDLGLLKAEVDKLHSEMSNKVTESHLHKAPSLKKSTTPISAPADEKGQVMYCGVSSEGEFFNLTTSYIPGKSLFQVTIHNNVGEFEVCNKPESIVIAKRSVTEFIKPACVIEDISGDSFTEIVTLEPGKVKRVGDSWKIVDKAKIRIE